MGITKYSTRDAAQRDGAEYWRHLHDRLAAPIDVRPRNGIPYEASLKIAALGSVSISELITSPVHIEHTRDHIARISKRSFSLVMPLKGRTNASQYGHQVELAPGDFVFVESHAPFHVDTVDEHRAIMVTLDRKVLRRFIPVPEEVCGHRMNGSTGLGRVVSRMFPTIWRQVEDGLPEAHAESVARSFFEMIATCYAMHPVEAQSSAAPGRMRLFDIKRMIETHLDDERIDIGRVADSLGVSTRYVHRLFAFEGETATQYIWRRRLEEAAKRLTDGLWTSHSVTQVALSSGFSSPAHFSRKFKERFGVAPTEYRKSHVRTSAPVVVITR